MATHWGEGRRSDGGGTGPGKSAQLFHTFRRTAEYVNKGFAQPGGKLTAPRVALLDRALNEPEPKGIFPGARAAGRSGEVGKGEVGSDSGFPGGGLLPLPNL